MSQTDRCLGDARCLVHCGGLSGLCMQLARQQIVWWQCYLISLLKRLKYFFDTSSDLHDSTTQWPIDICHQLKSVFRCQHCHQHIITGFYSLCSTLHRHPRLVLCDTHDTSILIVDTYVTIPLSPRSRYTAVYRVTVFCTDKILWHSASIASIDDTMQLVPFYHLAECTLQVCDAETNSKVAENHNYHSTTVSTTIHSSQCRINPSGGPMPTLNGALLTPLPSPSLPFPLSFSFPPPFLSIPSEVGPLNTARWSGGAL